MNILTGRLAFIDGRTIWPVWLDGSNRGTVLAGACGGVYITFDFGAASIDAEPVVAVLSFLAACSRSFVVDGSDSADSFEETRFRFGANTSAGLTVGSIGTGFAGFT